MLLTVTLLPQPDSPTRPYVSPGFTWMETPPTQICVPKAKGCRDCTGTGYKGRVGTHEVLVPNDDIRALINERSPSEVITKVARKHGMITLHQDSMEKVAQGTTSVAEALGTVRPDEDLD